MAVATQAVAVFQNVTLDDFDAIFTYSDDKQFSTNDPSKNSSAFALYHDRTAHFTSTPGAYVNFTFQGSAVYLYGASGPSYGSYSVDLDGQASSLSAYAPQNGTLPYLLYSATDLNMSQRHAVSLRNLGPSNATEGTQMLVDFARFTVPLAVEGATLTNTTVENDSSNLTYTGLWESNSSPFFSGGTTTYTNATGASVSLTFSGSAIYVFGDANNDHYAFNVTLDGVTTTHHSPLGCGGEFEPHACEKIVPGLQYFAGPLNNDTRHTITVTNYVMPELNYSYFDLDRFMYTTPSSYLNIATQSEVLPAGSVNSSPASNSGNTSAAMLSNLLSSALLATTAGVLLMRLCSRFV